MGNAVGRCFAGLRFGLDEILLILGQIFVECLVKEHREWRLKVVGQREIALHFIKLGGNQDRYRIHLPIDYAGLKPLIDFGEG
jgi:hypothetical protein